VLYSEVFENKLITRTLMSDPIDNLPNDTEDTSIADAWREIAEELFSTPGSTKQEQQDDRFDLLELPGPIRSYPCKDAFQRLQACYLSQSSKCEQRWKEVGKCLSHKHVFLCDAFHLTCPLSSPLYNIIV